MLMSFRETWVRSMQLKVELPIDAPPTAPGGVAFAWRSGLLGLLTKNAALSVITLGFYRFWARTQLRWFFWSSISVDGDRLEYTGEGIELFIGFLIALAVLAPLGFIYDQITLLVEPESTTQLALTLAYLAIVLALVHVARYRSRR